MRKPAPKAMRRKNWFLRLYVAFLVVILGLSFTGILAQKAFATTYVITDGDRVMTCTTFATDPARVLNKAGVSLDQFDTYTAETTEGAAAITISRAQRITIHHHGKTTTATSTGETVGELLTRLQLDVTGEDVVSYPMETGTFDGMVLTVERIQQIRQTYSTTVPHAVTRLPDPTIPTGTQQILTKGVDGEMLYTADVTYVNGREIARLTLEEIQVQTPITEVVAVGTGAPLPAPDPEGAPIIADNYILLPTGEVLTYTHKDTVRATAYTHTDEGCDTITATGTQVHWGTVAVDPRYIPYGTRMFIMSSDGSYIYGIATAEDCGGDIKGDRMDLYMPTYEQCMDFGRRPCTLYFLG